MSAVLLHYPAYKTSFSDTQFDCKMHNISLRKLPLLFTCPLLMNEKGNEDIKIIAFMY